jgi:WD40 repeat protein
MASEFGGTIPKQGEKAGKTREGVSAPTVSSSNKAKGGKDAAAGSGVPRSKQLEESACDVVGTKLSVKHAFGYSHQPYDEVISYQSSSREKDISDRVIYRVGNQVCIVDPDGNTTQKFLSNRPKHVAKVLHLAVSKNNRYLSVCEGMAERTHAQLSIYSLTTLSKSKTITKPTPSSDFVQSCFFAESKYLAILYEGEENQVIVYHWEKEKQYKIISLPTRATKLYTSPAHFMFTVSGPNLLRHCYLPPDGILKLSHMFSAAVKENDNFVTHAWLPFQELNAHRVIALCAASEDPQYTDGSRRQLVHVFEGPDAPYGTSGPPIALELKTTITLRLEPGGAAMSCAVHSKGFVLFGLNGFVTFFERTDDKRDPFVEARRLTLGGTGAPAGRQPPSLLPNAEGEGNTARSDASQSGASAGGQSAASPAPPPQGDRGKSSKSDYEVIISATVLPSEENVVMLTKSSRVLIMPLTGIDVFTSNSAAPSLSNSMDVEDGGAAGGANGVVGNYTQASSPLTDLHFGGNHQQRVMGIDVAYQRPVAVSIAHDCSLRIWNFENMKCELSHEFPETPYAVAMLQSGFQVIVSFKDKIRMYNILQDKLRQFRETSLKGCKELKLSNNNSMFAAAAALSVYVYDTRTFQQLLYLQGHIGQVRKLCWAPGDMTLFSAGADGNTYGWSMSADIRVDVSTSSNNRSSPVLCLAVDGQQPGIIGNAMDKRNGRIPEDWFEGGQLCKAVVGPNSAFIGFSDGVMKVCEYSGLIDSRNVVARSDTTLRASSIQYDSKATITAVCISIDKRSIYCGLSNGCVRAYPWPFMGADPPYVEVNVHAASVVDIREVPTGTAILSISEDGTVFYISTLKGDMMSFGGMEMSMYTGGMDVPMNSDLILATREDIEEHVTEVQDLQKKLHESMQSTDYAKHNLELVHGEEVSSSSCSSSSRRSIIIIIISSSSNSTRA